MAREARTKIKASPKSDSVRLSELPGALVSLLSNLADLGRAFGGPGGATSPSPDTLLPKLATAHVALGAVDRALHSSPAAAARLPRGWQEDLDREGVGVWNQSTALRCASETQGAADADGCFRKTIAERACRDRAASATPRTRG